MKIPDLKKRKSDKTIITFLLIMLQLFMLAGLSSATVIMINRTASNVSYETMRAVAESKEGMARDYVENAENILALYSVSNEINELLADPDNPELAARAQQYTEAYSTQIDRLEGIYVSKWDTTVLAHTNPAVPGLVTRTGDRLEFLQDSMLSAGDGAYNAGIIISPASGKKCLSMYKAVYGTDGKPAGLVGLGIYTDVLVDRLANQANYGLENTHFYMIDYKTGEYIFYDGSEEVPEDLPGDRAQNLCSVFSRLGDDEDRTEFINYKTDEGTKISMCAYMADEGWIVIVDDSVKNIMTLNRIVRIYVIVFLIIFAVMMIGLYHNIRSLRRSMRESMAAGEELYSKKLENIMGSAGASDHLICVNVTQDRFNDSDEMHIKSPLFRGEKALEKLSELGKLHFVEESHRDDVAAIMNQEYLLEQYELGIREIKRKYRYRKTDGNVTVYELRFCMFDNPQSGDVEATLFVNDITSDYYRQTAGEYIISNCFQLVGLIHFKTDSFRLISMQGEDFHDMTRRYSEMSLQFIERMTPEDRRSELVQATNADIVRKKLRGKKRYVFTSEIMTGGARIPAYFEYRYTDDSKTMALLLITEGTGIDGAVQ